MRAFTASMTSLVFTPVRATTTPPTASFDPLTNDATRNALPICTFAICSTYTGVPFDAPITIFRMSSTEAMSPTPRTINHAPFDSRTLPPTLRLLSRTAATTALSGIAYWRRRLGSTSIWYCWT
jgi:hypothetical protein